MATTSATNKRTRELIKYGLNYYPPHLLIIIDFSTEIAFVTMQPCGFRDLEICSEKMLLDLDVDAIYIILYLAKLG